MSDHTWIMLLIGYTAGRELIDIFRVVRAHVRARRQGAAPRAFTGLH